MNETERLCELLRAGGSPVQVVKTCAAWLEDAGFRRICYEDAWELLPGGRYYMIHHDSALFAFALGERWAGAAPQSAVHAQTGLSAGTDPRGNAGECRPASDGVKLSAGAEPREIAGECRPASDGVKLSAGTEPRENAVQRGGQPGTCGRREPSAPQIRMAAAHTDFPCLRIKPSADVSSNGYAQVNIEVYGGAILSTWLDRPLGVAGRVAVRGDSPFAPRVMPFSSDKSLLTIPNLAIHMNREVNKGVELNKQVDMLPVMALSGEEKKGDYFLEFLAEELSVAKEDILDYELTVYCREEPEYIGPKQEFLSSPRLDNLTSCAALVSALIAAKREEGLNLIALFDHEEIGSRTKQGAGSMLLHDMLLRILAECGRVQSAQRDLYNSMLLSVDVAHGTHPNQPGKMDLTNKPVLGRGVCIKEASAQSYATDCEAVAVVQQLCEAGGIPYQKFVNRSDVAGGGTLGSIASALLPVKTVDIGIPLLAMHSARELMGSADQEALVKLVQAFLEL